MGNPVNSQPGITLHIRVTSKRQQRSVCNIRVTWGTGRYYYPKRGRVSVQLYTK